MATTTTEVDLREVAAKIRIGGRLTVDERRAAVTALESLQTARRAWDEFATRFPGSDDAERARHQRGQLAFVLDREL